MATRSRTRHETIEVTFINANLTGWGEALEVDKGTTVGDFFEDQMGDVNADDYQIRVNRDFCTPEDELQDGDIVSVTPTKIVGA